jgi:beta-mannosidase
MRDLFESVVDANMNMLRVWSSGIYLDDWVYDIADELGILLWSEFQFGDALYPVDEEFLDNVREEAVYQVRRVNHHPSLALWAGGNELENLELAAVKRIAPELYDKYLAEYEQLFLDTLAITVFENSRSISYTPSSSGNGWQSLNFSNAQPITQRYDNVTKGYIYGNTDYYNYNSAFAFNTSSYPVGRFSNEFGYHSMPSLQSWRQAVAEEDLHFNSSTIMLRNHHYPAGGLNTSNFANSSKGMAEMTIAAQRWYPVPNKTDSVANFSAWCHVTQVFQADYYKSQIQFYRRGSGRPERQLGSLYWQLEDIWQAPTWAGIEYDGRWKVLHHVVKDIYQNVIISPFHDVTTGELEVYVTSDLWEEVGGTARFEWFDWAGNPLSISTPKSVDFTVGAINTTRVLNTNLTTVLADHNLRDVVLKMDLTAKAHLPNDPTPRTFTHTNWFHATPFSQANLIDPELQLRFYGDSFSVRASQGVAAWVWLDSPAGSVVQFSENGFWLAKGEEKTITWKVVSGKVDGEWAREISVESLWDMGVP